MTTPPPATGSAATPPPATEEAAKGRNHRPFGEIFRESVLEGNTVTVTVLALFTAAVLGGLLVAFTNTTVLHAWGNFFSAPWHAIAAAWNVAIASNAAERVQEFDVRTTSADNPVGTLSGGNQQKVILARELGREHKVLVASQPTRGLDVGSIEFVHRRIVAQRDHGVAVLIVSSELDEIYALADRIAVMYEGRITGVRPPTVPVEELGLLMAGAEIPDSQAPRSAAQPEAAPSGAAQSGAAQSGAAQPGSEQPGAGQ